MCTDLEGDHSEVKNLVDRITQMSVGQCGSGHDFFSTHSGVKLLTHYKARTEALCESIEKSPIDVNVSKARGTFVAQSVGDGLAVQR